MVELAFTQTPTVAKAVLKQQPDYFVVEESLGWQPGGEGEHEFLWVHKCNKNTRHVAAELARYAGIKERDVSYSGLKDKQASTYQWFSLYRPGQALLDWTGFDLEGVAVIDVARHNRKLRRGSHQNNKFSITLVDVAGDVKEIEQRLQQIAQQGFPNFFGPQRFGFGGNNLAKFDGWVESNRKPQQHDIYLSAARSHLFNVMLQQRQAKQCWNHIVAGDVAMLNGSQSVFAVEAVDSDIEQRCAQADIHPTAALWGKGRLMSTELAAEMELDVAEQYPRWSNFLVAQGLKQERRATRALAQNLSWEWLSDDRLKIEFALAKGCYATSLLAEVFTLLEEK